LKKLLMVLCLLVLIMPINTDTYSYANELEMQMKILIDIPLRQLSLYKNGEIVKTYPVAVGKPSSQTPTGEFKVINKVVNPYYSRMDIPGGSPNNPLGSRWIGFKYLYGIHGNSNPKSIGTFASGGCVRMYERDVQELYNIVSEGTTVTIKYDLLKVEKDVDGLNPVLIVYPDYYSKQSDMMKKVNVKLGELGLAESIPLEKIERLTELICKKQVVFSDKWTYFINGRYVTNDIINNNGELLVNVDKIGKYFNTEILQYDDRKHIRILDLTTPVTQIENKNYMPLAEIEKALGGLHSIDSSTERVDYRLNYILLNNKLIAGEALDILDNPKIPLESLINALRLKVDIKKDSTKILYNNKEIQYSIINEEPYIEVKKLIDVMNVRIETFTIDSHIEIFSRPDIIYNDTIFKGRIISKEVYIPYSMLEQITGMISTEAKYSVILNGLGRISFGNEEYVKVSDLAYYFDIKSDLYNTKIYIKKKTM